MFPSAVSNSNTEEQKTTLRETALQSIFGRRVVIRNHRPRIGQLRTDEAIIYRTVEKKPTSFAPRRINIMRQSCHGPVSVDTDWRRSNCIHGCSPNSYSCWGGFGPHTEECRCDNNDESSTEDETDSVCKSLSSSSSLLSSSSSSSGNSTSSNSDTTRQQTRRVVRFHVGDDFSQSSDSEVICHYYGSESSLGRFTLQDPDVKNAWWSKKELGVIRDQARASVFHVSRFNEVYRDAALQLKSKFGGRTEESSRNGRPVSSGTRTDEEAVKILGRCEARGLEGYLLPIMNISGFQPHNICVSELLDLQTRLKARVVENGSDHRAHKKMIQKELARQYRQSSQAAVAWARLLADGDAMAIRENESYLELESDPNNNKLELQSRQPSFEYDVLCEL